MMSKTERSLKLSAFLENPLGQFDIEPFFTEHTSWKPLGAQFPMTHASATSLEGLDMPALPECPDPAEGPTASASFDHLSFGAMESGYADLARTTFLPFLCLLSSVGWVRYLEYMRGRHKEWSVTDIQARQVTLCAVH